MSKKVVIEFENEKAAEHFALWLCGSGEQHYWDWMEYREDEDEGPITALHFDYHTPNGGEFGTTIVTKCGRLNEDE